MGDDIRRSCTNCDVHGVEPTPNFKYSIRVDGVFTETFRSQLTNDFNLNPWSRPNSVS